MKLNLKKKIVGFDTETTGVFPYRITRQKEGYPARPFVYAFCDPDGNTKYIRWKVDPFTREVKPDPRTFRLVQSIIENEKLTKIAHNLNFDYKMSKYIGLKFRGSFEDTIILAHVVTGGSEPSYALKEFCKTTVGFDDDDEKELEDHVKSQRIIAKKKGWMIATKETHGDKPHKADYWLADDEILKRYATQDAERTMLIWMALSEKLKEDPNFLKTYEREKKLFFPVFRMEERGVRLFVNQLNGLQDFYNQYKFEQVQIADKNGGKGLNFRSPKQKSTIFYTKRKYQPKFFTKKGSPSVDGDSLKYFIQRYNDKLAKSIIEHNAADHMITGFIDPYREFYVKEDGYPIIHPSYKQTGTETGRLSGKDPNLMQSPDDDSGRKKSDCPFRIREAIGPRKDHLWYLPDYSGMEVWGFSFLCGHPSLTEPLLRGDDFHDNIARQVWGREKDYEAEKKRYRKRAKLIVFCKFYGGGVDKIAYLLEVSREEASRFVFELDTRLPAISNFIRKMGNKCQEDGKIVNPLGRTYLIPRDKSYRAVNYLVQGVCADILKEAIIRIDKSFRTKWKGCHLLIPIHDELAIEVPKDLHCKELMRDIVAMMQVDSKCIGCPIPLPVGMKIAKKCWAETTEMKFITDEWKEKYICRK